VSTKDVIFSVGVVLILLVALGEMQPGPSEYWSDKRRKEAASTARLGYLYWVLTWGCVVNSWSFGAAWPPGSACQRP
jgi:hypothetical protein